MKSKTVPIIAAITVVVIAGISVYYMTQIKKSSHHASTFIGLVYKWGVGDTLQNMYDSKSGKYQFMSQRDSLITMNFKLRPNNIIYLHSMINREDLFSLPEIIANPDTELKSNSILRYEFVFTYHNEIKKFTFFTDYSQEPSILYKAKALQGLVEQVVKEAEERYVQ